MRPVRMSAHMTVCTCVCVCVWRKGVQYVQLSHLLLLLGSTANSLR